MGCGSSSSADDQKDLDDLSIEEIEIQRTRLQQFDDAFNAAADPLNTLVALNNNLINTIDQLKEVAAAILGAYVVSVVVENGNHVHFHLCEVDDEGNEVHMTAEKLAAFFNGKAPALKAAYDAAVRLTGDLNKALAETPQVTVSTKKTRLRTHVSECKEEDEARIAAAKTTVQRLNNNIFKTKIEVMRASAQAVLNPKAAMKEIVSNIKKALPKAHPRVHVNTSALAQGNLEFDVSFGDEFDAGLLPPRLRRAYKAIFGEEGIVNTMIDTVSQIQGIQGQLEAVKPAIEGLPTDPNEITNMAQSASLPVMFIPKIPGRIADNTKGIARAPEIINGVIQTVTAVSNQIKEAIEEA
jgi:DNA-binding FrmR family transcriptional regulator